MIDGNADVLRSFLSALDLVFIFPFEAFEGFEVLGGEFEAIPLAFGIGEGFIILFIGEAADGIGDLALFEKQFFDFQIKFIGRFPADLRIHFIAEIEFEFAFVDALFAGMGTLVFELLFAFLPKPVL